MIVYLIMMIVVLAVVAGVAGMVLVGIEGRRLHRYPQLSQFLTRAAHHLNGGAAGPDQDVETGSTAQPRVHERV